MTAKVKHEDESTPEFHRKRSKETGAKESGREEEKSKVRPNGKELTLILHEGRDYSYRRSDYTN